MRSHRAILALLLCFLLDAAMPFEPAARGGVQLEIEDQGEEGVCARRHHAERPARADVREPSPPVTSVAASGQLTLAAVVARAAEAATQAAWAVPARPRVHAPDPASPTEDH